MDVRNNSADTSATVTFSVIVPVMNEEEAVPRLARELTSVLDALNLDWECLWINDGSTDGTKDAISRAAEDNFRHRLVDLDGNFGQSAALAAGFAIARGEVFGSLDGDGQNDPVDLGRQLERLSRGDVDMVNGIRARRRDGWVRRLSSRIGNGFRNLLTGETVTDTGCAIRVFRRECVQDIPIWRGMHRFLPTLARIRGYRITEMEVNHRSRETGTTKYGIGNRFGVGLVDTLAVCWMKRRLVWPQTTETTAGPPTNGAEDNRNR